MRVASTFSLSFLLVGLTGCGGSIMGLPIDPGVAPLPSRDPAYQTEVQIRYLGAAGVLIKRGNDSLLTAPFFSNPSIPRVLFGLPIKALPEEIDRFLGPKDKDDLAGVTAVLVAHAHYDHLMDVPYIKNKFLPLAKIYGSSSMKYTLAGDRTLKADDAVSVEQDAWSVREPEFPDKPPGWLYPGPSRRLRFLALKSEHAPVIFGLKFFEGSYSVPLQEVPTTAYGWLEGQTLAYLIDFMSPDGKTVEFRVHFQDAASTAPLGFPPHFTELRQDQKRVDVAIVCMPGYSQVEGYPEKIVKRLNPRFVVITHWENFFARLPDDSRDLRVVPTTDAERFIVRLKSVLPEDASFKLPARGAWMRFAPAP
jgi:L-ascorbate metabolism protein UlaG (beta-lactamase superfamily)